MTHVISWGRPTYHLALLPYLLIQYWRLWYSLNISIQPFLNSSYYIFRSFSSSILFYLLLALSYLLYLSYFYQPVYFSTSLPSCVPVGYVLHLCLAAFWNPLNRFRCSPDPARVVAPQPTTQGVPCSSVPVPELFFFVNTRLVSADVIFHSLFSLFLL